MVTREAKKGRHEDVSSLKTCGQGHSSDRQRTNDNQGPAGRKGIVSGTLLTVVELHLMAAAATAENKIVETYSS